MQAKHKVEAGNLDDLAQRVAKLLPTWFLGDKEPGVIKQSCTPSAWAFSLHVSQGHGLGSPAP